MISTEEERAHNMIFVLSNELISCWETFLIAEQIHSLNLNSINCNYCELAILIQTSCINSTVLSLAKLCDHNKDSISIDSLLNYARGEPSAFTNYSNKEEFITIVDDLKEKFNHFTLTREKINEQRDHLIAHMDKKLLQNLGLHEDNPISVEELKDFHYICSKIIYSMAKYLRDYSGIPDFDKSINHKINSQFSALFKKSILDNVKLTIIQVVLFVKSYLIRNIYKDTKI